jgi:hypothetical protein
MTLKGIAFQADIAGRPLYERLAISYPSYSAWNSNDASALSKKQIPPPLTGCIVRDCLGGGFNDRYPCRRCDLPPAVSKTPL